MALTPPDMSNLLIQTEQPGIYIRTGLFDSAVSGLLRGFRLLVGNLDLSVQSPGFIARRQLEQSSYEEKFPQFLARVSSELPEMDGRQDDLTTLPSACLCLYPLLQSTESLPQKGLIAAVTADCFRNETDYAPHRMRAFTMSEYVYFGEPEQIEPFRHDLTIRVQNWLQTLGLHGRLETASDPFFGRLGELLAEKQRAHNTKLELSLPISDTAETSCFSFNNHNDFFASRWTIKTHDGAFAHSACVGVGVERLALAMFHRHGPDLHFWPAAFRDCL